MSNFPKLLKDAFIRGNKVCFCNWPKDLTDEDVVEYMQWKSRLGINVLTKQGLRKLLQSGQFVTPIKTLFERQEYLKN